MSILKVDTIGDTSGSGNVNIQAEGTNTTNLSQGLVKQWVAFDMTDSSIGDSFNTTTVTDVDDGDFNVIIANDFANIHYAMTTSGTNSSNGDAFVSMGGVTPTVTQYRLTAVLSNGSNIDFDQVKSMCAGDLA